MNASVPLPRRCTGCGAVDVTVLVDTTFGDRLCSACWIETTHDNGAHQPPTPSLDAHIARVEAREASR